MTEPAGDSRPRDRTGRGRPPHRRGQDLRHPGRPGDDRPRGHRPDHPARRVRVAHRAVRLWQVDAPPGHRGSHRAERRDGPGQRQAGPPGAPRPRLRDGLPGAGPVRLADRGGQRPAAARDPRWAALQAGGPRPGDARPRRAQRLREAPPVPALRWHAAASGDRARPGILAVNPAHGRTLRGAGRDDSRADERRGAAHLGSGPASPSSLSPTRSPRRSSCPRGWWS